MGAGVKRQLLTEHFCLMKAVVITAKHQNVDVFLFKYISQNTIGQTLEWWDELLVMILNLKKRETSLLKLKRNHFFPCFGVYLKSPL